MFDIEIPGLDVQKLKIEYKEKKLKGFKLKKYQILSRYDFKCAMCGSEEKLTIHHVVPLYLKKEKRNLKSYEIQYCEVLCVSCHSLAHSNDNVFRLRIKEKVKFMSYEKADRVSYVKSGKVYHGF